MTAEDIRKLLEGVASGLELGKRTFPVELSRSLVGLAKNLDARTVSALASLSGVSADEIMANKDALVKVMEGMDALFTTNQSEEIADFCRRVQKRGLLLRLIAWHLG